MPSDPPSGTLTILFADVQGSTKLLQQGGSAAWERVIDRLDDVFARLCDDHGGHFVGVEGDVAIAVFPRVAAAVASAVAVQRAFADAEAGIGIGLHTGELSLRRGRYYGIAMHRAALLAGAAHPGQILASSATAGLIADAAPPGVSARDLGEHALRGMERPERVHQLVADGLPTRFPPPVTGAEPTAGRLPAGTVTFLFSDIEDSTRLQQQLRGRYGDVLAAHRRLYRDAATAAGGREVDRQGDAFFFAFARARDAVAAAAACQRAHAEHDWPEGVAVRVRMGMHTGEPSLDDEGYLGLDVVRAARICSAANGGQVLVSEATRVLLRGDAAAGIALRDLGEHELKDLDEPERIFQLEIDGLPREFPPLRAQRATTADALARAASPHDIAAHVEAVLKEQLSPLADLDRLVGPSFGSQVTERAREAAPPPSPRGNRRSAYARVVIVLVIAAVVAIVWLLTR
jgi:class 3 adenylate cyclase